MHELSVGGALLRQVESIVLQQGALSATGIRLRLGPLCGVEPALLRTAFEQLRRGSVMEDATLTIVETRVRLQCGNCGIEAETQPNRLVCPLCGSTRTVLAGGDEMLIESVDVSFERAGAARGHLGRR